MSLLYSVVVPVFRSEGILEELYERIKATFDSIEGDFELILVEDCGGDNSWEVMKKLRKGDKRVKIINLMRNFGQHNATICGLNEAQGDYMITIDDDLQNPPEEIPKLISEVQKGYKVVFGEPENKQHIAYRNLGSSLIRWLNQRIFGVPKHIKMSSFRILSRIVTDELVKQRSSYPYISGMLFRITSEVGSVTVRHDSRKIGKSNYTFHKLVSLSFNLLINYSTIPLSYSCFAGFVIALISFLVGLGFLLKKLILGVPVQGWTTLVVLMSLINGIILVVLAILGEYISRILGEVSQRPQYLIREKIC